MNKNITVILGLVLAAGCSSQQPQGPYSGPYSGDTSLDPAVAQANTPPPMDPKRKVNRADCSKQVETDGRGNLLCRDISERERRAMLAEQERQAKAKREAEERAAREKAERERAEQLAREEEARKARAAEEERLAAERRRLEEEAARKAEEERLRQEKLAEEERLRQEKLAEEARLRAIAEQEAREAAERECQRLAQLRADGRALLVSFVDNYSDVDENKGISKQITTFLNTPRKAKPCPAPVATEQPTKEKSPKATKKATKKKSSKATVATTAPEK